MIWEEFDFVNIKPEQGDEAADIEQICFPPNEACSREDMKKRAELAGDTFIAAIDKYSGKPVGFITGIATNETAFRDEFFTDITLHDKNGENVMILSLCVLPEYRGRGIARELMRSLASVSKDAGKKKMILTCIDEKVKMYEKMCFKDLGESASLWGGHKWHEMERDVRNTQTVYRTAVGEEELDSLCQDGYIYDDFDNSGWYPNFYVSKDE